MDIRRTSSSIATKLAFWFCLSSIVLTVLLSEIIERVATTSLQTQISEKLAELAYQATDKLDQGMFERFREVQLMASRNSVTDPAVPLSVKQTLVDQIHNSYRYYAWIGIADASGHVLVSAKGILAGADVSARPWFVNAMNGSNNVGDLHEAKLLAKILPAPASGEPLRFLDVAFPYYGSDGKVAGVLGTHLSWEWAHSVEQSVITPAARRNHIEALIVGQDGTVLLGPKGLQGSKLDLPGLRPDLPVTGSPALKRFADQRDYLVGYSKSQGHPPFPGFGWTVLVRQDAEQALAPVRAMQRQVLWSGFGIAVLFSLFGVFNARRVTRPLRQLADDVRDFRRGSLPTLKAAAGGYREIGELSQSFVALVDDLQQNEAALRNLNASLESRVSQRTAELEKSEERVRRILENSHDAFIAIDGHGCITDWNRQAEASFGWSRAEAIGQDVAALIIPPDFRDRHRAGFARFLQSGTGPVLNNRMELTGLHRAGHEIPIEMSVAGFHDGNGYVANAFLRDITQRKEAARQIIDSEARLRAIADNLPVLISYVDRDQRFQFANATFQAWLGIAPAAAIGMHMKELLGAELYEQRRHLIERALAGEEVIFDMASQARGIDRHLHTIYVPNVDADGVVGGFYTLTSDVSDIKRAEHEMTRLARHDSLTGLPNRFQLDERLDQAVRRCRRTGIPMAVMFLDIDHFKRINDSLGHAAGDEVLKEFSARLSACVRSTDTVARLAGDEFIVLLEGLHVESESHAVARKILHSVAAEISIAGRPLYISTSIGIAYTDGSNLIPHELMAHADRALYAAKAGGRNAFVCTALCGNDGARAVAPIVTVAPVAPFAVAAPAALPLAATEADG